MDAAQDGYDVVVLVLSPDYLDSQYCMHELKRAVAAIPPLPRVHASRSPPTRESSSRDSGPKPHIRGLDHPSGPKLGSFAALRRRPWLQRSPRLAARNSGHWLMEQAPDRLILKLVEFLNC